MKRMVGITAVAGAALGLAVPALAQGPGGGGGFQPTPEEFQFGVCAPGGTDSLCSFPANKVPKALDVIPPADVSQATELNPLLGAVQLRGITMP